MALSVDTKVKELMKNEAAADLLEKFSPGFKTNPQMKLEIDAALKALGE